MKIAIISFGFIEHVAHLSKNLSKKNDVLLCVPTKLHKGNVEKMLKLYLKDNVNLFTFKKRSLKDIRFTTLIMRMKNTIKHYRPDVICIEGGHPWLIFI